MDEIPKPVFNLTSQQTNVPAPKIQLTPPPVERKPEPAPQAVETPRPPAKGDRFSFAVQKGTLDAFVKQADALNIDELFLQVRREGVSYKAVDPAHVVLIEASLYADEMDGLVMTSPDLPLVGISIGKLKETLKGTRKRDIIRLEGDVAAMTLEVHTTGPTRTMDLTSAAEWKPPKVPTLDLPSKVALDSKEFEKALRACEQVSDWCTMSITPESFKVSADGENDTVYMEIPRDELVQLRAAENARSHFALDLLRKLMRVLKTPYDVVHLDLGIDYPLRLTARNTEGAVRVLVAPRIER